MRRAAILRKFGRSEVQSESIGSWLKINESFEVTVVDWPLLWREAILVVVNCQLSIKRLRDVCALARDQENLLMNLDR